MMSSSHSRASAKKGAPYRRLMGVTLCATACASLLLDHVGFGSGVGDGGDAASPRGARRLNNGVPVPADQVKANVM